MRPVLFSLLLLPGLALAQGAPWATGRSRPEDLRAYLVTFGPGEELVAWWGHTALVIEDRRLGEARLYNYGMFSFDRAMLPKFVMGHLEFWVAEAPFQATLRWYRAAGRRVSVQELNLLPVEMARLALSLGVNVQPENRTYLYDHYLDNCSSRPRDIVDAAIGGQLKQATAGPGRYTLREQTRRYTQVSPPWALLLDFAMNDLIDRPILVSGEAFLPEELERQLASAQYVNARGERVPLVSTTFTVSAGSVPHVPDAPPSYFAACLAIGVGAGALLLALSLRATRRGATAASRLLGGYQAVLGLFLGLPGTAIFVLWLFTDHTITYRNENLFFANPGYLALVPLGIGIFRGDGRRRAQSARLWYALGGLALLGLVLKLLPWFDQKNAEIIALLLPISLSGAAAAWLLARRGRAHEEPEDRDGHRRDGTGAGTEGAARSAPGASLTSTASDRASR